MAKISDDLEMFYQIDDFTDPWLQAETILLLHGNAESSLAWYGWVPRLSRRFRVVRPDMRGFGSSTPMPRDFPWTIDTIVSDYLRLMDILGIQRFHLVGAKIGGTLARSLAARHPDRVSTLVLIGTPPPRREGGAAIIPQWVAEFEQHGVEHWARRNMAKRLGSTFPAEGVEWWAKFMGRTPVSTQIGFISNIGYADISADVPRITCPTLVMTTRESGLASVEQTRAWQRQIPDSSLLVLDADSYHVAASHAADCLEKVLEFISKHNR